MENDLFSTDQLYKFALTYFKENEGRNFHVQFDAKVKLVALTQQAHHGNISAVDLPPIGALDVIGKQRRAAWALLGEMGKEEAKEKFVKQLVEIVPDFQAFITQKSEEESRKVEAEAKVAEETAEREAKEKEEESRKQMEEFQRRKIQDALNRQTFSEFKAYSEQQYPDNPDQQAVLIKQLQEQHYYQYMQQLVQQQGVSESGHVPGCAGHVDGDDGHSPGCTGHAADCTQEDECSEEMALLHGMAATNEAGEVETSLSNLNISQHIDMVDPEEATMWQRKDINDFKETIIKEEGDAIIKVGHGETVTIRVPTHKDGKSLYWEFATDTYDIGFGVFFEWVEAEDTQVTVHISDSEDEDEEDYVSDEEGGGSFDPETGKKGEPVDNGPPTSCIVPIYRRDCHEEVYAGSHNYPAQGVYLLKFDNSFSLWRSKTLYYRVYYTR